MVGEQGQVLCRSSPFGEDASGYAHLFELLGPPEGCLLALEATGHYWRNLFVALSAKGYAVAVLNPLRTRRFAEEELQRTKTDAIDALGIARFAAQKRPPAARLPDSATEELRELARLRERRSLRSPSGRLTAKALRSDAVLDDKPSQVVNLGRGKGLRKSIGDRMIRWTRTGQEVPRHRIGRFFPKPI
jgi:Transposase